MDACCLERFAQAPVLRVSTLRVACQPVRKPARVLRRRAPHPIPICCPGRRFRASDPRCAMELDEIDPARWAALEAATDDYIALPATQQQFANAAAALGQVGIMPA